MEIIQQYINTKQLYLIYFLLLFVLVVILNIKEKPANQFNIIILKILKWSVAISTFIIVNFLAFYNGISIRPVGVYIITIVICFIF